MLVRSHHPSPITCPLTTSQSSTRHSQRYCYCFLLYFIYSLRVRSNGLYCGGRRLGVIIGRRLGVSIGRRLGVIVGTDRWVYVLLVGACIGGDDVDS